MSSARIVLNHSTHVPDLVDALKVIAKGASTSLTTIVPGRLARTRGRAEHLSLSVSVAVPGGFRVVARKGSLAQEVFISTRLGRNELQSVLEEHLPRSKKVRRDDELR